MKLFDTVKLLNDYNELPAGTEGTIVLEYDGSCYEVEFFDSEGDTIDVITIPASSLELVSEFSN